MDLFHCFGAIPAHRVDTDVAVAMLRASGCRRLAVNTHTIGTVARGDDLPVGYASATFGSVRAAAADLDLSPVLNINHPTSAAEAVARTLRAVDLTGIQVIKLEVLDDDFKTSRNDEVVRATEQLRALDLEVWPLIVPEQATFDACVELGSAMVRVMGSPIGSRGGLAPDRRASVEKFLADGRVPVMLDGGVGSLADVEDAARTGFDSVLVNSFLFAPGTDPATELSRIRIAIDRAEPVPTAGGPAAITETRR